MFQKKPKKHKTSTGWTDKAARKIGGVGIKAQQKFSVMMNKLFEGMPVKRLKLLLVVFCVLGGGYSIYLAVDAITDDGKRSTMIKVDPVNVPKHFEQKNEGVILPTQSVADDMYKEIQNYKRYMDSLGQPIRQSLLDSIKILEDIYQSQTIK